MLYHDEFVTIAFAIFLLIFSITAAITLLSLVGKVKIAPLYQKKLFRLLILEVVGVVIAFVSNQIASYVISNDQESNQVPVISEKVLLDNLGNWDWCYPESAWRTKLSFKKHSDSLTLSGTTFRYYLDSNHKNTEVAIIDWKSMKPFSIQDTTASFPLSMKRRWEVLKFDPNYPQEDIEKWFTGIMKLETSISIRGTFLPDSGGGPWGVVLTHTFQ